MGRRSVSAAVLAACALLGALAASPAAQAEDAGGGDAVKVCRPGIKVLASSPGGESVGGADGNRVDDLGPHGLAVGASRGLPVYWTGTRVHRVPLPAGYTGGRVTAVNQHGLMVGTLDKDRAQAAFSYRPGARQVRLLPGGEQATDVNNRGHAVGFRRSSTGGLQGLEWVGDRLRRTLPQPGSLTVESVTGINDAGQITGSGYGATDPDEGWYDVGLLWPPSPTAPPVRLQPYYPGDTYTYWQPQAVDERGRVVGTSWYSRADISRPLQWAPPYASVREPGLLGDRTKGTFDDISPTTGVSVGTASDSYVVGPGRPRPHPRPRRRSGPAAGRSSPCPASPPTGTRRPSPSPTMDGWAAGPPTPRAPRARWCGPARSNRRTCRSGTTRAAPTAGRTGRSGRPARSAPADGRPSP